MNEHEAQRIAAAINVIRPDWPIKSLVTLISAKLAHRPRRDVLVALAWVACETATATPARVLENGPWWRAVAVDEPAGNVAPRVDRHTACGTCGLSEAECRRRWSGDHAYESQSASRAAVEAAALDVPRAVAALRELTHTDPEPRPERPAPTPNPHIETARKALHAGEVGTGAGGVDDPAIAAEATSWVNRSVDCPEAPAQAHLPTPTHETARALLAAKEDA